jgi:histidyl-tRNA synthetase
MVNVNPLKGFRDFYPKEKGVQNFVFKKIREVAKLLGYEEYDGPVVEPMELYLNKTSKELIDKQTFKIQDKNNNILVLRPEMTPTLARMVANKTQNIIFPTKLFNIGLRYRYEAPQKGREREFYQMDFDILGSDSLISDAESIYTAIKIFQVFGSSDKDFVLYINSRSEMEKCLLKLGFDKKLFGKLFKIIDKQDKINNKTFVNLLLSIEKDRTKVNALVNFLYTKRVEKSEYFNQLFQLLKEYRIDQYCQINYNITRGLDYYTGLVFEIREKGAFELKRALLGGGRYNNLIKQFNKNLKISGVGFALSDVVLMEFLKNKNLLPKDVEKPITCLTTIFNKDTLNKTLEIVRYLRDEGLSCDLYQEIGVKLDKQLKYANKKGIPYIIIIGPEEIKKNKITIRNMKTGEQKDIKKEELLKVLK